MFRRVVPSSSLLVALAGAKNLATTPSLLAFQFKSKEDSAKPVQFNESKNDDADDGSENLKFNKERDEKYERTSAESDDKNATARHRNDKEKKSLRREDSPAEPSPKEKQDMINSGNPFKQARAFPSESQARATMVATEAQLQRDVPDSKTARKMADESATVRGQS